MSSKTVRAYRELAVSPRAERVLDVLIAAAALAGSLALVGHGGVGVSRSGSGELDLLGALVVAAATMPLLAWRRLPFGVFTLTASASVLLAALGYRFDVALGPAAALYLLAASRTDARPWTPSDTRAVVGMFVALLGATAVAEGTFPASELLHSGLAWAVAWFAGERSRLRRVHIAELVQRARDAERDGERERELAAAQERARIARDLHDSAGHAINVIAVRAGAARLRHHQQPDRSLQALGAIEELARQTAAEVDQIVGTLRTGHASNAAVESPPGLASLDSLIAHHAATGLDITVAGADIGRPLRGPADQAAYRILQEALTNAARHGAGSARIQLDFGAAELDVVVTNPVHAGDRPRSAGGHGLAGMRERITLLGGDLHAKRANGGFVLRARIPYGDRGS